MANDPDLHFLRLFPLQAVVLFPGMELPLTVFEPRYLQLTRECTHNDEPFGVLLLKDGREVGINNSDPFEIGTTAHITEVSDAAGGRLSVTAIGRHRFKVHSFIRDNPYLAAQVEFLQDASHQMVDPSLIDNVKWDAETFVRELVASRGGYVRDLSFPDDPIALSCQVAQIFHGDANVQQKLLEQPTFDRLWDELELLKDARRQMHDQGRRGLGNSFSAN